MKGDVVTPQILFLYVEFLDGGKWEKHFPVLFSGNMGGGAEFPVIRVMEKPKFLHSGTCTSTSSWRVTLKAPLLLQFPYCKLSYNNNWAIIIIDGQIIDWWMFCSVQEPYFLILANIQSNKRQEKETVRFSHWFCAYMHLFKREIFHSYKESPKFFTFLSFLDQSSSIKS